MMKKLVITLIAAMPMLVVADVYTTALAYGAIKGNRVTAMVNVDPINPKNNPVVVYTTPEKGQFFITQFCQTGKFNSLSPMWLDALRLDPPESAPMVLAKLVGQECIIFPNPLAVSQKTELRCSSISSEDGCSLSGILSK